ncbi:MAG: WD40 repeat domain-containing serine/threonine protein kinase [Bryobacteraceae bacterium]
MTPEHWKEIEDLYLAVSDLEPERRQFLLSQAAPGVRNTVMEMLTQTPEGKLLDRPAWESESDPVEENLPEPGMQLGPYRIEELLGRGGMGRVFRAFDSRLGRDVAIKLLPPGLARDPEQMRRFEQEAWAAGTLSHPNVVTVYDVGTHEGISYVVTELLSGWTLRDVLRNGPLPRTIALEYAHCIAIGLVAAHDRGITHGDLKPENLFVTEDGRLKILDFGLAKLSDAAAARAADGERQRWDSPEGLILGTVGYMSPEQIRGEPLDHRSDLFNLGVVLLEMLTGQRAFQGSTPAETLNMISLQVPAIADDDPRLGPDLARILRHSLEKDPRQRFQSARDLDFSLDALKTLRVAVTADNRKRWWPAAAVGGVVLGAALLLWTRKPERAATFQQLTFRSGNITGGRFTQDGQTIVYSAGWEGKAIEPYVARVDRPETRPFGVPAAGVLAISAKGELALMLGCELDWGECRGTIARVPLSGGAPKEVAQDSDSADWSPQGELAIVRPVEGRFRLEYPIGKVLYENPTGWISHLRFSPKGDRIAFLDHPSVGSNDGSVEVVDLSGRKTTLASNRNGLKGLAWSPSGEEVWFSGSGGRAPILSAISLAGRERVVLQTPGWSEVMDIAPDGRVLLLRQNPRSNIVFGSPGQRGRSLSWFDWSTSADISADGRQVLFYEWGEATGGVPISYLRDTSGGEAVRLGEGKALALSPDQKWALALQGDSHPKLILLPIGAGQPRELPTSGLQEFLSAAWFPDGKRFMFVAAGADHVARTFLQDLEGGAPQPIGGENLRAALVSPDGRELAAYASDGNFVSVQVDGGASRPIPGMEAGEEFIQWSADGHYLYIRKAGDAAVELLRLDPRTGQRTPWRTLDVPDRVGFVSLEVAPGSIRITPDGKSTLYTYWQARGELYVADGLK